LAGVTIVSVVGGISQLLARQRGAFQARVTSDCGANDSQKNRSASAAECFHAKALPSGWTGCVDTSASPWVGRSWLIVHVPAGTPTKDTIRHRAAGSACFHKCFSAGRNMQG